MGPGHRKLLPAPSREANEDAPSASTFVRRKRAAVRVACNRCRTKKTSVRFDLTNAFDSHGY